MRHILGAFAPLVAGTLAALPAGAQTSAATSAQSSPASPPATYFSAADLKRIEDGVPPKDGRPGGFSKRLFSTPNYSDAFIRISAQDRPHAHGKWSEVYIVVDGSAVIETGGTISGAVEGNSATHRDMFLDAKPAAPTQPVPAPADPGAPKDLAGVDIVGGHRQQVGPGDVILIPAGVPHRWLSVERPIVYHDVKFPR